MWNIIDKIIAFSVLAADMFIIAVTLFLYIKDKGRGWNTGSIILVYLLLFNFFVILGGLVK